MLSDWPQPSPKGARRSTALPTPERLARLWRAAEAQDEAVWRDIARFLIAVPCRRSEAARVDWSHIDLTAAEWRQPRKLTKNRGPHRLHLHSLALAILKERHEAAGRPRAGLVFPAPKSGKAVDTFTDIKADLVTSTAPKDGEEGSALDGWTWHDFRRSFATAFGEAGIAESVADAVLNHRQSGTRGGVLGVYRRATRWPEQKRAMELWGRMLADAIEGRNTGAEVIAMPAMNG